jgi:tetratricopeptide (TPR) repeat protein
MAQTLGDLNVDLRFITAVVVAAAIAALAAAEPLADEEVPSNCRCCALDRVHAPYLKGLPAPDPTGRVGTSHLRVTTRSPEAQAWFDRGLNLLHCFWEFEAYRCFLQALEADPDCAMAYWGVCMALPGARPEAGGERAEAFERARSLAPGATPHEQLYIEALGQVLSGGTKSAIPVLRRLLESHPGDVEAAAFLALWLRDGYGRDQAPNPGTREALELANRYLADHPHHVGFHHYKVHILEGGPHYEEARASADILPKLAPASGHIVHMPGHIYYLSGEFGKACAAFRASRKVEGAYLTKDGIPPYDAQNYLHNLHYLAFAAAEAGRREEALAVAGAFAAIEIPADRRHSPGAAQVYYLAAATPAMMHMRFGEYAAAAETIDPATVPEDCGARHYLVFLRDYCLLKSRLHAGVSPAELSGLRFGMEQAGRLLVASEPRGLSSPEMDPWRVAAGTVRILLAEIRVWMKAPEASPGELDVWIDAAAREQRRAGYMEPPYTPWPVEEEFGRLFLDLGDPGRALRWFRAAEQVRPGNAFAHLGAARSLVSGAGGAPSLLRQHYERCASTWAEADPGIDGLNEVRRYLPQQRDQSPGGPDVPLLE